jgi:hypothetical protein
MFEQFEPKARPPVLVGHSWRREVPVRATTWRNVIAVSIAFQAEGETKGVAKCFKHLRATLLSVNWKSRTWLVIRNVRKAFVRADCRREGEVLFARGNPDERLLQ